MPQLRWEGGKGANLRGKIKAVSSSEARYRTTTAGCLVTSCGPVSSAPSDGQLQAMSLGSSEWRDEAERGDAERELEHRCDD